MANKPTHHHGDLRAALIAAGIEILERDGISGLSLRKITSLIGVSHAAPAHHFKGKTELLVAIATQAFATFADLMEAARARASDDPYDRLLGLCRGYLEFAEKHEALFELIFSTDIKAHSDDRMRTASVRSFHLLEETCAPFEPSPYHAKSNEIMIWSLVHGYANLRVYSKIVAPADEQFMPFEFILPPMTLKKTQA